MMLRELVSGMKGVSIIGPGEVDITSIEYDSRRVRDGALFVAITGLRTDGRRFAQDAVMSGAAAVASESVEGLPEKVALLEVPNSRRFMAQASARITGYPDKDMNIIGITGTNGKTTVTYLLEKILTSSGKKAGVIGTTGFFDGKSWKTLSHTTPESPDLWNMLKSLRGSGVEALAIEVSSHAIALERSWGLDVDVAVFTNLTQDHLDFHEGMDDYKETKFRLFSQMKSDAVAVINIDDEVGAEFASRIEDNEVLTYSIRSNEADLWIETEDSSLAGSHLVIHYQGLALPVFLHLPGEHNVTNLAAASLAALASGVGPEHVKQGTQSLACVPGRMEPVPNDKGFFILVDYAHTPDALRHLIRAARSLAKGKVITLFGCGGDRDKGKRAKMGRIAARLSDFIFVTSDNPRTEDRQKIIEDILEGIDKKEKKV
ncbi:UDP-N-acetylmuramoyl-L-alanyl-D-glutamate--2,6-diaminopimelate ligase, partial [candidate division WOR-3 bacterium]|nr:UDP-N-acetylmuramoyl-L-alanyl-D-glutamate--2,6-diaminopimelate ligase [candidate division WOR-3 bacterium]MBD3365025.1 UDP-N-acetylmuramoyl-L-alanyl-D-glutamate--2,6-diaminopimelate ligase [candidate division WOR-3 bacterium]